MTWYTIELRVRQRPRHEDIRINKWSVQHPSTAGFYSSNGEPQGQLADFRKRLSDGRSLHVREYEDCYLAHWDAVDPSDSLIGHLIVDAPLWALLLGILGLGAISFLAEE